MRKVAEMRNNHYQTYAVILGLEPIGLSVTRELGKLGIPLCGVTGRYQFEFGKFSRYLERVIQYTDWENLYLQLVEFANGKREKPVLLPTLDVYIDFIARYNDKLAQHYNFQSSYKQETVNLMIDKKHLYESCQENNIPYPITWSLKNNQSLSKKSFEGHFPLIAKPRLYKQKKILRGKKVFIIESINELEKFFANYSSMLTQWILQEIIPGPESNIYLFAGYFNKNGDLSSKFTGRKLRQLPVNFGVASLVVSEQNDEVADLSSRYLKSLNFHGICETEFKLDERDGKFKMIEPNPRPPLWMGITSVAGIKLAYTAYADLSGEVEYGSINQTNMVLWRYFERDLRALFVSARNKNNEIMPLFPGRPFPKKKSIVYKTGAIWDATDMKPSLYLPLCFLLAKMAKRLHLTA